MALQNFGRYHLELQNYDEAKKYFYGALQIYHNATLTAKENHNLQTYNETMESFNRALQIYQTRLPNSERDRNIALAQGWANFLYGGPHLKKMFQPRAANSHYKIGKFTLCVKKHIFILNTVFFISHSGALGRHAPRFRTLHQTHRNKMHTFQ